TQYLADEGLAVDQVVHVSPDDLSALKVRGLPTLVLVDSRGVVRGIWEGRLSKIDEQQLWLLALRNPTS
ncbi:MAG TPA: hypothetical protein VLT86_07760, partial [Vicinamibacterales bacterium]|nr:hypothetical protein [Vicinamibacterales bacterium]